MKTEIITPEVNETQEFIEIAFDFSNPLDLVREAISNSFDAKATKIKMLFEAIPKKYGKKKFQITLEDDGTGMDMKGLKSFFDLGNSLSRGDDTKIGEKGHGTKVYINCDSIKVDTKKDGVHYIATMNEPKYHLLDGQIPEVHVEIDESDSTNPDATWTKIVILGYNDDDRKKFTHEQLKDYILWFTKMGSIEKEFGIEENKNVTLALRGVDRTEAEGYETLEFGHFFPAETPSISELLEIHMANAPKYYCKRWLFEEKLENSPESKCEVVFYLEGSRIKHSYNNMIRRPGHTPPEGAYSIQERYGLWICKDYMPIQRKNEWITKKGSEYTKFHAFINCQELRLTANRGSIENTPSDVMKDIQNVVTKIYEKILESDEWFEATYLEDEAEAYNTTEKEEKDFKKRIALINKAKIATYHDIHLVEPQKEQGVFSLYLQLSQKEPTLFPFTIVDYDTHSGIDVIVKERNPLLPLSRDNLFYVEFKYLLEKNFNHSFKHLMNIICWDILLSNNEEVEDISRAKRKLKIIPPENANDYTRYFLDDERKGIKIEIFVLKTYLKEKLGIDFVSRTANDCY